jgi:hypothetical protein
MKSNAIRSRSDISIAIERIHTSTVPNPLVVVERLWDGCGTVSIVLLLVVLLVFGVSRTKLLDPQCDRLVSGAIQAFKEYS